MNLRSECPLTRRRLLQSLAASLPFGAGLSATLRAVADTAADELLPPVRAITRGPKFHWRGYYDKLLFDPTNRFVLAGEVDFEHRSPKADDTIRVGMVDTHDGDKWIELGQTVAWNWQQGCMLQWLPGSRSEVIWNDRQHDRFVCHILDIESRKRLTPRTLDHPIYCLSPDGRWALSPDFRRLNDCRPGYGYAGLPDPNAQIAAPDDAGIWRIDMQTGKQSLIFSFADAAKIPFAGGFAADAKHWFNHLLFSPDGKRFVFLHRWRGPKDATWQTRMFSADTDGGNPFVLIPTGKVSHFVWRDATHVTAYAGHPRSGEWRFCVFEDRTQNVEVTGEGVLQEDGHCTYVPGTENRWLLNDTYPDKLHRQQHPHLFHIPTGRRVPLGHFPSPAEYRGEWRCDTHPSVSRDGRWASIDSPHNGGRQVYLIDLQPIIG